ncbi:MAG: CRTAC1 family protein [Calditrichaeota bacterium]|nr:MAG: CRTAC1 family protein [Calditrichota bacterium]
MGAGAAWLDYDGDGDQDLYVVNGATFATLHDPERPGNTLYRNDGDHFTDVTRIAGVGDKGWGIGCAVGDIDNDGDPDLYVTNYGPNVLYRNNGDGTFTDITEMAGVGDERMGASCAFGDYNNDGYLDLYLTNYVQLNPKNLPNQGKPCYWYGIPVYCGPEGLIPEADVLYRNNGDGTFTDVSRSSGIAHEKGYGLGVIFVDYDQDGDQDIYVANDSSPNFLFRNNGDGTFTDVALAAGVSHRGDGREQAGMGVDFGDYDQDGDLDLLVTNFSDDYNTLYRNDGNGYFSDVTAQSGLKHVSYQTLGWGAHFFDFDNDADLDIFVANGHVYPQADNPNTYTSYHQRNHLYRNNGHGSFQEIGTQLGSDMKKAQGSRGVAISDFDEDGDLDIFIVNEKGTPNLLKNEGGNRQHWLRIKLIGTKSNRDGIGALVKIITEQKHHIQEVRRNSGYASAQDVRVHFGLGEVMQVDKLLIKWPSGQKQVFEKIDADQYIVITEGKSKFEVVKVTPH